MQKHLKHFTTAAVILFTIALAANANEKHSLDKTSVQKSGLTMLETDLQKNVAPEIVEGALYTAIEYKNLYPDLDYSRLLNTINKVAKENSDATIAYKAHLVSMYLSHSSEIHVDPIPGSEGHNYLFKQIADQLETKLLSSNYDENAEQ